MRNLRIPHSCPRLYVSTGGRRWPWGVVEVTDRSRRPAPPAARGAAGRGNGTGRSSRPRPRRGDRGGVEHAPPQYTPQTHAPLQHTERTLLSLHQRLRQASGTTLRSRYFEKKLELFLSWYITITIIFCYCQLDIITLSEKIMNGKLEKLS